MALAALRRHPTSTVAVTDTVQNIQKNLDQLQAVAGKITALATSDSTKSIVVTAMQYQKDGAALALWGAGNGQTLGITGVKAANATALAAGLPSYVTSISVSDLSLNIQANLDNLQTLATNGILREIVQSGSSGNLTVTASQLTADHSALAKIKNQAYTLSVTEASVSDTLGLGSSPSLSGNTKVKAIAITDTTDAIKTNLDALQQVGLRLKSITQTDNSTPLTVTADQSNNDRVVLGKILTNYDLAVINASAAQVSSLSKNQKVITVSVNDTAANLSRNWNLLERLTDSLGTIQVTDQSNDIKITSDQLDQSDTLLSKFTDTQQQTYKLAVTGVSAGTALTVSGLHNVDTVQVTDTSDNVASSLSDLQSINGDGKLASIALANPNAAISLDASLLVGDPMTATQAILDTITGGNYKLAATGAAASDLPSLVGNNRVVSVAVSDSSDNLVTALDTLNQLGSRLTTIEQTDSGTAFDLTQAQLDGRSSVLAKINGGYTANLSDVKAINASKDLSNIHVATMNVTDTGANILARWTQLRALGAGLTGVTKSDNGALSVSAAKFAQGTQDGLIAKFDSSTTFAVYGASVSQATTWANNDAVTQIDVSDPGSALVSNLSDLETLAQGDKLTSITNLTPNQSLSLAESQLQDAQPVLDLIKSGNYSLALTQVDVGDAKDLLAANHRIASMAVTGDSSSLISNLSDLTTLGSKVTTITQTDGQILNLSGDAFDQNAGTLAKIQGGYLADLSGVSAAKAAAYAANASVNSLDVSDSGAHVANAWVALNNMGDKLTSVTQNDSSTLQLNVTDWLNGQDLRAKFVADPTVSISGADVSQVDDLAGDSAVQAIQVSDSSDAISGALSGLSGQSKITQVVLDDPTAALNLTAQAYGDSAGLLSLIKDGQYQVSLSNVSAQSAATLASDAHVASMDVSDSSSNIASHFDALAAANNLNSIALSDQGGTVTLSSAQILGDSDTLAKFTTDYKLAATAVAMTDLSNIESVPQVTSIGISDSADNVSSNFGDLLALGDTLSQVHLTDTTPVLSLDEASWTAGTSILGKINSSYQVDVSNAAAGDAASIAADTTVRDVTVADTASNLSDQWDSLVSLYNSGAGKLTGLSLTDNNSLTLTTVQQASGAAMISDLLADETIQTV